MAISRHLPSKTLEEIMAEVSGGLPTNDTLLGSAQVLPAVGETLDGEELTEDAELWVDLAFTPDEES